MENNFVFAFSLTVLAGLCTIIGGLVSFFVKKDNVRVIALGLGFSAGIMIYVSLVEIIKKANESLSQIKSINSKDYFYKTNKNQKIGPLWMGKIGNKKIIKKIIPYILIKKFNSKFELLKLLEILEKESDVNPFFYSTDKISSNLKKPTPKIDFIFNKLNEKGYYAIKTHFSEIGFKTNAPINEIENIFI